MPTNFTGGLTVDGTMALLVGGGAAVLFGAVGGFGIYAGTGVPTVSAAQGSLYLRTDGTSSSTRAYINNSVGVGTSWTALMTVA